MTKAQTMPLDEACIVEYGTRVVQKRDGGSIFPVYGGGGATFHMDSFNREDRLVVARFGMSETCTRFVSGRFFLNDSGLTVSSKDGVLDQRFLDYQLLYRNDDIFALGKGSAQKNLDVSAFRQLALYVPSEIAEQLRIVAILDEAFAGIAVAEANAEVNLQQVRAAFQQHRDSVLARNEGWTERRLSDICAITSNLVDPRRDEFLDLPHIGAGNIESETGALCELMTAREEGLVSGKFVFDRSMVLYSKIRPYLRKVVRPDFDGLCSADIYPLAPLPDKVSRDFLVHLLLGTQFTDYAIKGSARAGMPKVNRDHLFDFRAWFPSVDTQAAIAANLDSVYEETRRLEAICHRKLAALNELRQSLLHRAFCGQL